jgi:hypothetical protein
VPSPGETSSPDQPSDPATGGDEEGTTDPPPEQTKAIEEVTNTLSQRREEVPEELTASVDSLTATLQAVTDPATSPQDREAVTDSAKDLASTLGAISDDSTPDEVRDQLTGLVKQLTSTLEAGQEPDVAPEDRSRILLVAKRTAAALDTISDPETPPKLRLLMTEGTKDVNQAVKDSEGRGVVGHTGVTTTSAWASLADPGTPNEQKRDIADRAAKTSRQLKLASDPKASPEERAQARQKMRDRAADLKDAQEKAAAAQDPPDASLGKAAEVCTNSMFEALEHGKLSKGLKDLTPSNWNSAGVKDFWKASNEGNDVLDVRAQLQNDQHTHAPFEVARLITKLADLVLADDLNVTLGERPAAYCKQTAVYLGEQGVTAGDWLATEDW